MNDNGTAVLCKEILDTCSRVCEGEHELLEVQEIFRRVYYMRKSQKNTEKAQPLHVLVGLVCLELKIESEKLSGESACGESFDGDKGLPHLAVELERTADGGTMEGIRHALAATEELAASTPPAQKDIPDLRRSQPIRRESAFYVTPNDFASGVSFIRIGEGLIISRETVMGRAPRPSSEGPASGNSGTVAASYNDSNNNEKGGPHLQKDLPEAPATPPGLKPHIDPFIWRLQDVLNLIPVQKVGLKTQLDGRINALKLKLQALGELKLSEASQPSHHGGPQGLSASPKFVAGLTRDINSSLQQTLPTASETAVDTDTKSSDAKGELWSTLATLEKCIRGQQLEKPFDHTSMKTDFFSESMFSPTVKVLAQVFRLNVKGVITVITLLWSFGIGYYAKMYLLSLAFNFSINLSRFVTILLLQEAKYGVYPGVLGTKVNEQDYKAFIWSLMFPRGFTEFLYLYGDHDDKKANHFLRTSHLAGDPSTIQPEKLVGYFAEHLELEDDFKIFLLGQLRSELESMLE
jgi:hypothetical protein